MSFCRKSILAALVLLPCNVNAQIQTTFAIDDEAGCQRGKASEKAQKLCSDFSMGRFFASDPEIQAAKKKCLAFYETALRTQNTFCSYRLDAVIFAANSEVLANTDGVGKANVSESSVATDNAKAAEISKAYLDKLQ